MTGQPKIARRVEALFALAGQIDAWMERGEQLTASVRDRAFTREHRHA